MISKAGAFLNRHIRLGYVSALLFVDMGAILLIGVDTYRYGSMGLSIRAAVLHVNDVASDQARQEVIEILACFTFILPVVLAVSRVLLGSGTFLTGFLGVRKRSYIILHIVLSTLIAISPAVFYSMQMISGLQRSGDGYSYLFTPQFEPLITLFASATVLFVHPLVTFSGSVAASMIAAILLSRDQKPEFLVEYNSRCLLADLGGELYPVGGRYKLNFNAASVGPDIRAIVKTADTRLRKYQEYIAGSHKAAKYLLALASDCKELLKDLLFQHGKEVTIDFFPGTSRALEVSLSRIPGPKRIILSPFEHPAENVVVQWYAAQTGDQVSLMKFDPSDYSEAWPEQLKKFGDEFARCAIGTVTNNVLVLSAVCYATGLVLPVSDIISHVRDRAGAIPLKVVIDGAHLVGNGHRVVGLSECDSFVFSAHKWLLAPEPCGILLSRGSPEVESYDEWGDALPLTTASVRMIAGLLSALEVLKQVGFANLWTRSDELRKRFLERTKATLIVIGADSRLGHTHMIVVRPVVGTRWKFNAATDLREYLEGKSVNVLVLSIDHVTPWLRISFPYFLDARQVDKLAAIIEDTIEV